LGVLCSVVIVPTYGTTGGQRVGHWKKIFENPLASERSERVFVFTIYAPKGDESRADNPVKNHREVNLWMPKGKWVFVLC
jgi:hypothetical protein